MADLEIRDGAGNTQTIPGPNANGRAAAAASKPVAISTEDKASLDAITTASGSLTETAPASDTASSGLNGRLQRIAQRLTSLIALWTAGNGTAAAALRVTSASDDPSVTSLAIIDDWDESDRAKANIIVGQAGVAAGAGAVGATVQRTTLASDDPLVAGTTRGVATCTATITRPADTTAYAVGDALSNSTSAPTAGGGTFTSAVAVAGKSCVLTDIEVISSAASTLAGELWIFDTAPTAINDNAAFTVSDAEMLTRVAMIPFALSAIGGNSSASVQCHRAITTVASANLRFLVRVTNAYTPESAETLTFRAKFIGIN